MTESIERQAVKPQRDRRIRYTRLSLIFTLVMVALHFLHLGADPSWSLGSFAGISHSSDLYTDEGWESNSASRAVLQGSWYTPGDLNLAVKAPFWPLALYLLFKEFTVAVTLARALASIFFAVGIFAT